MLKLEETTLDIHRAFRVGARTLAKDNCKYTELHKGHGIDSHAWDLLTQDEVWSADEVRQMRSVLGNIAEVAMSIAGMPSIPLPGQYMAAVICEVVAPCNRFLAAMKVPATFDAVAAAGITESFQVKEMSTEQMMALVLAYSGEFPGEPEPHKVPKDVKEMMKLEAAK